MAGVVLLPLLAVVVVNVKPVVVLSCAVTLFLMNVALLARITVGGNIAAVGVLPVIGVIVLTGVALLTRVAVRGSIAAVVVVVRESCVGVALLALRR